MQGAGGVGGLVATALYTGTTYFPVYDGNGNVMGSVSGATGTVAAQHEHGPFGEVIRATSTITPAIPIRWSTKYTDLETDLVYYGYRYYNPSTGRWLSRDPIGEKGGNNLYGFLDNDPICNFDPLGLRALNFKVGRDVTASTISNADFQKQVDKFLEVANKCTVCTSISLQATLTVDQKGQTGPTGICIYNGKEIKCWEADGDAAQLTRNFKAISGTGVPVLLTGSGIKVKRADARAVSGQGDGILFNEGFLGDLGILAHEIGHYAGWGSGHSPDPKNIMHETAPADGSPDKKWCDAVLKLFK
jgi:RHS repeat-associated protein